MDSPCSLLLCFLAMIHDQKEDSYTMEAGDIFFFIDQKTTRKNLHQMNGIGL
jgi:hypothetical protein